ncbi:Phist protein (Pf-fam-b) [Plasmodium ovale wallikeri]|nr:Phist protein (Pf-fam-b) [Plasmodium ovale wallikeri]SBT56153.1 Phist protein (Pf-fam-b) [Plasmodium ovale wallikeri]
MKNRNKKDVNKFHLFRLCSILFFMILLLFQANALQCENVDDSDTKLRNKHSKKLLQKFFLKITNKKSHLKKIKYIDIIKTDFKKKKKKYKRGLFKELKKLKESFHVKSDDTEVKEKEMKRTNYISEMKPKHEKEPVSIFNVDEWSNLDEENLYKKIENLKGIIGVIDMYNIWNCVHAFLRKKYFLREEYLWNYCEEIAEKNKMSKEAKMDAWYKVYYAMKDEIMEFERKDYNRFYRFIDKGPREHEIFVSFLFFKLETWRIKMKKLEIKWKNLLYLRLKSYKKQE